jgi:hypothetical protein
MGELRLPELFGKLPAAEEGFVQRRIFQEGKNPGAELDAAVIEPPS